MHIINKNSPKQRQRNQSLEKRKHRKREKVRNQSSESRIMRRCTEVRVRLREKVRSDSFLIDFISKILF